MLRQRVSLLHHVGNTWGDDWLIASVEACVQ